MKVLMCGNHPANKGGMTSVISLIRNHNWEEESIDFDFLPTYLPGNKVKTVLYFAHAYMKLFLRFLTDKPDVFYTHMSYKGSFTRTKALHSLCKKFKIRDIIHLHGSEFQKWYESCNEKKQSAISNLITDCDSFIVLGENWKQFVQSIAPRANVQVLNNSVVIPSKTVAAPNEICNFLYLGVLIPRKGVEDLIKAATLLKERNEIEGMHFYIGGTGSEEDRLQNMCTAAGLNQYVDFCGWIQGQDKEDLILKSHVFVLPSYNEGLPMAILEAMSYGMPIISTNVGSIGEAARQGDNALLFCPGDVDGLAHALKEYASDPALWAHASKASRESAKKNFSNMKFFDTLGNIFSATLIK